VEGGSFEGRGGERWREGGQRETVRERETGVQKIER